MGKLSLREKIMYVVVFLKEHGKEIYTEVRGAYIDTMNKVLSAHFRAYIQALEKLQLDIATSSDLIGVEARSAGLFYRGREPLKNRSAVFALGDRINILKEIDQPALIPHIAEASSLKYPYELIMSRRRIPCLDSYLDKVNISLWPRFKMVFDMHLNSLRNANVRTLWEDDIHPHYVMRRYAEFTASLVHINVEYGDGQEAGSVSGKAQMHFEEVLKSNTTIFVEELLLEHFNDLIKFVKNQTSEDMNTTSDRPTIAEIEPLVKDFAGRWKAAIELMHKDVITSFSNFLCGMEILKAALTQLLLYYTRLSDCIKKVPGGSALNKDLVSISSIMYEIKKYSRTF
ncbi:hypothetical protein QJS04_geneDACA003984 [Acorus gramineus]|uniref:Vps52 C-terminal domain-containing protein n=1 Tax=Acorus gramineus TaxID=55184 RepID=A0AAV9BIR2_ACOGR|nr:hypothetical protein QJS04_geneDACA003984 [Acorus gramineus]